MFLVKLSKRTKMLNLIDWRPVYKKKGQAARRQAEPENEHAIEKAELRFQENRVYSAEELCMELSTFQKKLKLDESDRLKRDAEERWKSFLKGLQKLVFRSDYKPE
jgi:hypothetical protein